MVTRHIVRKNVRKKSAIRFSKKKKKNSYPFTACSLQLADSLNNLLKVHQDLVCVYGNVIGFGCCIIWASQSLECNWVQLAAVRRITYKFHFGLTDLFIQFGVTDPYICSLSCRISDVILIKAFSHIHIYDLLGENMKLIYDASCIMWRVHVINWVLWDIQAFMIPSTHHQSHTEKLHLHRVLVTNKRA